MVMLQNLAAPVASPITEIVIRALEEQIANRRASYTIYRAYYGGHQNAKLTDRLKRILQPEGLEFRDNFSEVVVDALAERLKVIGFESADEKLVEWAWTLWMQNRMDYLQGVVHTEAAMLGDAYVLVDWNAETERPRFAYQPPELIVPHYGEESQKIEWASKKWLWTPGIGQAPVTRLNLYYPDRVEKYAAASGVWRQHQDEGEKDWPQPWTDDARLPLGVPIIHFRNKPLGAHFGGSELINVIPLQDMVNKIVVDLAQVLDTMAFGQRWTLDIVGSQTEYDVVPGAIAEFHSEDPERAGAVGEFVAADPTGLLYSLEMTVQHIAGTSRTPQHLFQIAGGDPSGESLRMAESGLVNKARERSFGWGNSWEDCFKMALRLDQVFGTDAPSPKEFDMETSWDQFASRDVQGEMLALQTKRDLGVPRRQLWREMGYTEAQIVQMEEDLQEQKVAETNLGAAILEEFNKGRNV